MLQDLRAVNKIMVIFGALQPGLPSPGAIPSEMYKIVLDLKDCFFSIPLHPDDCPCIVFSLPSTNYKEPMQHFQWKVLPQGMTNSPTLCQKIVAHIHAPIRAQWPDMYMVHYMDDILLAGSDPQATMLCCNQVICVFTQSGFQIAPDKIRTADPYTFLGFRLQGSCVLLQKSN